MNVLGTCFLRLGKGNTIEIQSQTFEDGFKGFKDMSESAFESLMYDKHRYEPTHLMTGLEFEKDIRDNCFTDYDGYACKVLVDGYNSNLRLSDGSVTSSLFGVSFDVWHELCEKHEIFVDWVNK